MYVHAAESQRSKPTHGGTGVHPTVTNNPNNDTAYNLLLKDRKRKMNSQRTKQLFCKPHKPSHDLSLQKSCFLADAPDYNDNFDK